MYLGVYVCILYLGFINVLSPGLYTNKSDLSMLFRVMYQSVPPHIDSVCFYYFLISIPLSQLSSGILMSFTTAPRMSSSYFYPPAA